MRVRLRRAGKGNLRIAATRNDSTTNVEGTELADVTDQYEAIIRREDGDAGRH